MAEKVFFNSYDYNHTSVDAFSSSTTSQMRSELRKVIFRGESNPDVDVDRFRFESPDWSSASATLASSSGATSGLTNASKDADRDLIKANLGSLEVVVVVVDEGAPPMPPMPPSPLPTMAPIDVDDTIEEEAAS